jgi:hypothetical protein
MVRRGEAVTQEIIQMARDSGMELYGLGKDRARFVHHLEAFAKLIAEAERKACAKFVDHILKEGGGTWGDAIRARGEQEPVGDDIASIIACRDMLDAQPVPPRRTWVGLNEQQRNDIEDACEMIIGKPAFDLIDAALKGNNT